MMSIFRRTRVMWSGSRKWGDVVGLSSRGMTISDIASMSGQPSSKQAQWSVIYGGLLALFLQQYTQAGLRMDRNKNPQQNQIFKSTYLSRIMHESYTRPWDALHTVL